MFSRYHDLMLKPFNSFDTFRLIDDLYGQTCNLKSSSSSYRVDSTDDGLELSLDLPGVKGKDLNVQVTDRLITVSGKLRGEDFKHSYRISKDYDPETIDAAMEDGVLTLSFNKSKDSVTRSIEVKTKQ